MFIFIKWTLPTEFNVIFLIFDVEWNMLGRLNRSVLTTKLVNGTKNILSECIHIDGISHFYRLLVKCSVILFFFCSQRIIQPGDDHRTVDWICFTIRPHWICIAFIKVAIIISSLPFCLFLLWFFGFTFFIVKLPTSKFIVDTFHRQTSDSDVVSTKSIRSS